MSPRLRATGIDVFLALEDGAPRSAVARWLAELRRAGVAAETDYAGRSLKGQLTQARRLGRGGDRRRRARGRDASHAGRADEPLAHDEIVSRLSP